MPDSPIDNPPGSTRRLVAVELLPVLDILPTFELTPEILAFVRSGGGRPEGLAAPPLSPAQQAVHCEQRFVPGLAGAPDVRVLVYTPPGKQAAPRPAFLHLHGGGFVLGMPEINDGSNRALASELGCVVVSVDYRLAPETRFPGAVEDSYAALAWLHADTGQLGIDRNRIAIGGESAGGGHAAALAILARDRGEIAICLQLLDSPMLDDRTGSTSDPHPYCGEFVWTPANNRFGWRALLGVKPGGPDVPAGAVPARVQKLDSLPPAFISVARSICFLRKISTMPAALAVQACRPSCMSSPAPFTALAPLAATPLKCRPALACAATRSPVPSGYEQARAARAHYEPALSGGIASSGMGFEHLRHVARGDRPVLGQRLRAARRFRRGVHTLGLRLRVKRTDVDFLALVVLEQRVMAEPADRIAMADLFDLRIGQVLDLLPQLLSRVGPQGVRMRVVDFIGGVVLADRVEYFDRRDPIENSGGSGASPSRSA